MHEALEDDSFKKKKKHQMWHLLLWSVLSCKPAMTHFFVLHTAAPLGTLRNTTHHSHHPNPKFCSKYSVHVYVIGSKYHHRG